MKYKAGLLLLLFLIPTSAYANSVNTNIHQEVNGGDSNVSVQNNSNSSSSTVTTQNSQTSIHAEQTGNGTIDIDVNGKKWTLNGPGKIDEETGTPEVKNDDADDDSKITPSSTHTASATPTLTQKKKEVKKAHIQEAIESFLHRLFSFLGINTK